ncbi:MAG: hypothetical protein SNJ79_14620, partial [Sphingomonadaceae bacterium]
MLDITHRPPRRESAVCRSKTIEERVERDVQQRLVPRVAVVQQVIALRFLADLSIQEVARRLGR